MKLSFSVLFLTLPLLALAADGTVAPGGLDTASMNKSVDPCVDFYQYACGSWVARNPLPADRARFARFTELSDRNERVLLDILQGASAERSGRPAVEQKIGDAYAACMDTAAIEKQGLAPLKSELDRINALEDNASLIAELVRLQRSGVPVVFMFGAQPDAKDSSKTIATLSQGGLSLPDRDYYLKTDPKSVETRDRYVKHVQNMFQLAGDSPEAAAAKAKYVLEFETTLAGASVDRVSMRDPNKRYHIMTRVELASLTGPDVNWNGYFKEVGAPAFETLNVTTPEFFKQISQNRPGNLDHWKAYFTYHLLHARASELPAAFENESFDFWGRYLTGAREQRPRNMRCVQAVDRGLGDLLGQKYIEIAFGTDAKTQITQLVDNLEKALGEDIRALPWMTEETKKAALTKLAAITNNVGYPKKWRDYSKVSIVRDDFYGNTERLAEFQRQRNIGKIGTVTDKSEWTMTSPTVNAFYSPQLNSINFPAGILQAPFFDPRRDMAINYGGVGAVIGHEMTHGFDDQGRKFDGAGNLRDWWTAADGAEFEKRAACVANEYSGFTAVDDVKLNGRLTLGENTADNGGIRIAYMAMENALKGKKEKIDGFTPEQRFFLGYAQIWCENATPQSERQQALTNPHSPGRYRVSGVLQNMPEFQQAFSCKAGQPMVSANACRVW
ncbi:MAG TPA: M13 family metallopeptidase [Bryobacteraceae bacterium]|nr:M13 family metallopeptidase [Bryobacteraceae bacterium]